jgi:hypothetical protein
LRHALALQLQLDRLVAAMFAQLAHRRARVVDRHAVDFENDVASLQAAIRGIGFEHQGALGDTEVGAKIGIDAGQAQTARIADHDFDVAQPVQTLQALAGAVGDDSGDALAKVLRQRRHSGIAATLENEGAWSASGEHLEIALALGGHGNGLATAVAQIAERHLVAFLQAAQGLAQRRGRLGAAQRCAAHGGDHIAGTQSGFVGRTIRRDALDAHTVFIALAQNHTNYGAIRVAEIAKQLHVGRLLAKAAGQLGDALRCFHQILPRFGQFLARRFQFGRVFLSVGGVTCGQGQRDAGNQ